MAFTHGAVWEMELFTALSTVGGTLGVIALKSWAIYRAYEAFLGKPMRDTYVHRSVTDVRLDYLEQYAGIPKKEKDTRDRIIAGIKKRNE